MGLHCLFIVYKPPHLGLHCLFIVYELSHLDLHCLFIVYELSHLDLNCLLRPLFKTVVLTGLICRPFYLTECGSNVTILGKEDSFTVKSPNYPLAFTGIECAWLVKVNKME